MDNRKPLIQLKNISFCFPGGTPILQGLDLTLDASDRIGLVAPNGSGKTTLFHLIMGLITPIAGSIELFGKPMQGESDFAAVRTRIGLLFQDADDQLFSPTVLEDVAFGPLNQGKSVSEATAIARRTLDFLGLGGFEDRITFKLSGGEKRMVSLATVLALEPEVLLLDEPTSGLDRRTEERLVDVLKQLDLPLMLISHNPDFLNATVKNIYTMRDGKIVFDEEYHVHQYSHSHPRGREPHRHD
jgi:cobalt/nickel transport system ATP-binding protein